MVKLCCSLIVPGRPGFPTIDSYYSTLVHAQSHDIGMIGIDPDAMIIIATGSTFDALPVFSTINGLPHHHIGRINNISILRICLYFCKITAPAPEPWIAGEQIPRFTCIITPINSSIFLSIHCGIEPVRIAWGDGKANAAQPIFGCGGQPFGQALPCISSVGRFEQTTFLAIPCTIFPGPLTGSPDVCINHLRVNGINGNLNGSCIFIEVKHLLESLAAIKGSVNPTLLVGSVWMSQCSHKNPVLILGINSNAADLLGIPKPQVYPGLSCINGLVYTIAHRKVWPLYAFPAANIDNVRV